MQEQVKMEFWVVIGIYQIGMIFFRWDLKTPCIKNSEYESYAKRMILIVISKISHFSSPTLTNFWQSVFVSLFFMVYTLPSHKYFFFGGRRGLNIFSCHIAKVQENFNFLGDLLYQEDLIYFLGEGGYVIFFHKATNDPSCKLKNS